MSCCYKCFYWAYRCVFCCSRLFKKQKIETRVKYNSVHPSKTPWMWIGAEMENGNIITVTDTVNKYIEYDDVIDSTYLKVATNMDQGVIRWLYLDSKTLNEQEFPPDGLVIKNDSIESGTS